MESGSILLADTDPSLLEELGRLIFRTFPGIELTVCLSARQTAAKLSRFKYSTVIVASRLIQEEHSVLLQEKWKRHVLVPLVITAGQGDCELARDALLDYGAFDIIARPVQPTEALRSLQLALWQERFLGLVTQRERVLSEFECHLAAYLEKGKRGIMWGWISERVKEMLAMVRESMNGVDPYHLDPSFIHLAGSVQERTLKQALERLERMRFHRILTRNA